MPKRKSTASPATDDPSHFRPGSEIEISSNEPGFRGSWFTGVIIKRVSSRKPIKYVVQYARLFEDETGAKPLQETVDAVDIRPPAPRERERKFKFSEEVDAFYNDGWWEGVITKELDNGRFHVYFKRSKEQLEFGDDQLRLHREWINGSWTPPLEDAEQVKEFKSDEAVTDGKMKLKEVVTPKKSTSEVVTPKKSTSEVVTPKKFTSEVVTPKKSAPEVVTPKKSTSEVVTPKKSTSDLAGSRGKLKSGKQAADKKFCKGARVEATSDEEGFEGAWFTGTIVKAVGKDKYLFQYDSLRNDEDTDFLQEEFDALHIRPCPPEIVTADGFQKLDEVDAFYNDGWWVGVISKVFPDCKYEVYFKTTEEEMKFEESELRLHQDWINGKWVAASQVLKSQ